MRNLVLVLGDQLDHAARLRSTTSMLSQTLVWMAEVEEENTHVWCHKLRIAFFLSAMRHFRSELEKKGITVEYHELQEEAANDRGDCFAEILQQDIKRLKPEKLVVVEPGDLRVRGTAGTGRR